MAGLEFSPNREKINNDLHVLLQHNPVQAGNVKIVLNAREDVSWNLLLYFVRHRYPSQEEYAKGVKVITYPFERKDPNKKIWRPEFRKAVAQTLEVTSAFEAVLTDAGGYVREASKANVFAILDDGLITPPDDMILPGITRKYITGICHKLGIPIDYKLLDIRELPRYTGMFLSGTSTKVLPVSQVDEMPVPMENKLIQKISGEYENLIQEYLNPVKQT
jgi:branched-chain amino acid aminotransferase